MAVLHRAHKNGFCSALEQLPHSLALPLSLSACKEMRDSLELGLRAAKVPWCFCSEGIVSGGVLVNYENVR